MTNVVDTTSLDAAAIADGEANGFIDFSGYSNNTYQQAENHILGVLNSAPAANGKELYGYQIVTNAFSTVSEQLQVGVTNIASLSAPFDGAPLLHSITITSTGADQVITNYLASPVALADGVAPAATFRTVSAQFGLKRTYTAGAGRVSTETCAVALQPTFDDNGAIEQNYSVIALIRDETASGLSCSETLESDPGVPVANQTLDYYLHTALNTVAVSSGAITTDANGDFSISGLEAVTTAGTHWIVIKNQSDNNIAAIFPIEVA